MLAFSVPPGYRRRPPARPKLDPLTGIIDGILAAVWGGRGNQPHTAERLVERHRDGAARVSAAAASAPEAGPFDRDHRRDPGGG
jgi:hypothetical protein